MWVVCGWGRSSWRLGWIEERERDIEGHRGTQRDTEGKDRDTETEKQQVSAHKPHLIIEAGLD